MYVCICMACASWALLASAVKCGSPSWQLTGEEEQQAAKFGILCFGRCPTSTCFHLDSKSALRLLKFLEPASFTLAAGPAVPYLVACNLRRLMLHSWIRLLMSRQSFMNAGRGHFLASCSLQLSYAFILRHCQCLSMKPAIPISLLSDNVADCYLTA